MLARGPDDDGPSAVQLDRLDYGLLEGLDQAAEVKEALERPASLNLADATRRQDGLPVVLINPYDKITPADVVDVVRKGANAMHDGVGIESTLELDSRGFDDAATNEPVDADGQCHAFPHSLRQLTLSMLLPSNIRHILRRTIGASKVPKYRGRFSLSESRHCLRVSITRCDRLIR